MIDRIANNIVRKLERKRYLVKDKRNENIYATITMLEKWITICSIMLLSIILGKIVYTVLFVLFFYILRQRTGGYHAKSYGVCYIESILIYIIVVCIVPLVSNYLPILMVITLGAGLGIYCLGTLNSKEIDMNSDELESSKIIARYIVLGEEIVIVLLFYFEVNREVIIYCCMAIIICFASMCLAKLLKQNITIQKEL